MPKWFVTLEETFTYKLEVEGKTKADAEVNAFNSVRYATDDWDDNDARITEIDEAPVAIEAKRLGKHEPIPTEVLEAMAQAYSEIGYVGEIEDIEAELQRRNDEAGDY